MGTEKMFFETDDEVLMNVSTGKISIMEGARLLDLQDAGCLFHRLADVGLPLPQLSEEAARRQLADAKDALDVCLVGTNSDRA